MVHRRPRPTFRQATVASRNWSRRKAMKRILRLRRWAAHYLDNGGVLMPMQWYRLKFTLGLAEHRLSKTRYPGW